MSIIVINKADKKPAKQPSYEDLSEGTLFECDSELYIKMIAENEYIMMDVDGRFYTADDLNLNVSDSGEIRVVKDNCKVTITIE